jgi:hypothetical protein
MRLVYHGGFGGAQDFEFWELVWWLGVKEGLGVGCLLGI